jgi:hypothetical protein
MFEYEGRRTSMQGCARSIMMMGLLAAAGCQENMTSVETPAPVIDLGATFAPESTGTIQGRVTWQGELPMVPPFHVRSYLDYVNASRLRGEYPNPHAPAIDPEMRGVRDVVVILRDVKHSPSKPWSHATVEVVTDAERLTVSQGKQHGHIGFVRRGDRVGFLQRDTVYHALAARGAAFFTLPLVKPDRSTHRRLDKAGIVELSEGMGLFWRRAYLFVLEHPYVALSDQTGKFVLDHVPSGTYHVSAWLPNWLSQTVAVSVGKSVDVAFTLTSDLFVEARRKDASPRSAP